MNEIKVLKAAHFAALKHKNQTRKDHNASPYINHPIAVALTIAEVGRIDDADILAAALLHDTLEDTDTTPNELEQEFGSRIRTLVEEVTDNTHLPSKERKRLQVEHAPELSNGAVLIKLGDKIANVKDMIKAPPIGWSGTRRREYLDWAEEVIANCPKINTELENQFSLTLDRARNALG